LSAFVRSSQTRLAENSDPFASLGILQVLCEVVKLAPSDHIQADLPALHSLARSIDEVESLVKNTNARKLQVKLLSRCIVRTLPAPKKMLHKKRTYAGVHSSLMLPVEHAIDT
jgi:tubulin-specific chaperone D